MSPDVAQAAEPHDAGRRAAVGVALVAAPARCLARPVGRAAKKPRFPSNRVATARSIATTASSRSPERAAVVAAMAAAVAVVAVVAAATAAAAAVAVATAAAAAVAAATAVADAIAAATAAAAEAVAAVVAAADAAGSHGLFGGASSR